MRKGRRKEVDKRKREEGKLIEGEMEDLRKEGGKRKRGRKLAKIEVMEIKKRGKN